MCTHVISLSRRTVYLVTRRACDEIQAIYIAVTSGFEAKRHILVHPGLHQPLSPQNIDLLLLPEEPEQRGGVRELVPRAVREQAARDEREALRLRERARVLSTQCVYKREVSPVQLVGADTKTGTR